MNKEDILLKNYSILIKNPIKNAKAIRSIITQFCSDNPKLTIRCWVDILQNNINKIKKSIDGNEFEYNTFGYEFITKLERDLLEEEDFKHSVDEFAKNKQLLEILYTKFPIYEHSSVYYPIAFLIRNHKLQEANSILTAIYKNKTFNSYSILWDSIIGRFRYSDLDNYSSGGVVSDSNYKQDNEVQDFCMNWAERIADEEEQAGAITYIMRIF